MAFRTGTASKGRERLQRRREFCGMRTMFSRSLPGLRRNVAVASRNYAAKGHPDQSAHEASARLWRNLSLFVALPSLLVCSLNAFLGEMEHFKHGKRPEFVPYEYMRIRTKKFPWGDGNHSLLHHPKYNALPEGYEEDE